MDSSLLTHLLALVERTGDRLIVVDPASQKPVVLMGLAQYESLLGHADRNADHRHADHRHADHRYADQDADRGSADPVRGSFGVHVNERRGSLVDAGSAADVVPGTDPIARRGNAELAAWRAETPTDVVAPPEPVILPRSVPTMEPFSVEPLQSATHADDQFYVEPIE